MPSPMSMRQASSWSGPSPWKQAAGRMCATTSCADEFFQTEGAWKNAAPTCASCRAASAWQTPQWWWPTCSHTLTTASCWRLSTGCQSWPKTMQSSMCHSMWRPIRQVGCARSVTNINTFFLLAIPASTWFVQSAPQLAWFFYPSI